jgi:hypothetical protein
MYEITQAGADSNFYLVGRLQRAQLAEGPITRIAAIQLIIKDLDMRRE